VRASVVARPEWMQGRSPRIGCDWSVWRRWVVCVRRLVARPLGRATRRWLLRKVRMREVAPLQQRRWLAARPLGRATRRWL